MTSGPHNNSPISLPVRSSSIAFRDPLPADCSPLERQVDELLAENALRTMSLPATLADRIFDASASQLPLPATLKIAGTQSTGRSLLVPGLTWGRLALAASLGLAFCVCMMIVRLPSSRSAAPDVHSMASGHGRAVGTDQRALMAAEMESLPATSIDDVNARMSYLWESDDLNSLDEVRGEMNKLIAALDM
jgi:hypothetical protein